MNLTLKEKVQKGVIMQLEIRGQETSVIDCEEHETISQIKERILELQNVENEEVILSCEGKVLDNDVVVSDLRTHILDFSVPLVGGKVHGSLARAGKVRAQTPKVEKTEKSKKKTGRAKRRSQYNRRFVNVVQTFGHRRGPNANSNS